MRTMRVFGLILVALGVSACTFDDHRTCLDDTHCESGENCQFSYCVVPMIRPQGDAYIDVDLGILDMRIPQQDMRPFDQGRLSDQRVSDMTVPDRVVPDMLPPDQAVPDMLPPDQAVPDMGSLLSDCMSPRCFEATDDAYVTVNGAARAVNEHSTRLLVRQGPLKVAYVRFDLGVQLEQPVRVKLRLQIHAPSSAEGGVIVHRTRIDWMEDQNDAPLEWEGFQAQIGIRQQLNLGEAVNSIELELGELPRLGQQVAFWIVPTPGFMGELEIFSTDDPGHSPPQLLITKIQ